MLQLETRQFASVLSGVSSVVVTVNVEAAETTAGCGIRMLEAEEHYSEHDATQTASTPSLAPFSLFVRSTRMV